jgi:hypothetical protein
MRYTQYRLSEINGKSKFQLKSDFPTYGNKNQKCARLHIAICGRTIEIPYIWKFYKGREGPHNDFNGFFGIVDFESDNPDYFEFMPTPCTTKVSFYNNCPNYQKFKTMVTKIHEEPTINQEPVMKEKEQPVKEQPLKEQPKLETEEKIVSYIQLAPVSPDAPVSPEKKVPIKITKPKIVRKKSIPRKIPNGVRIDVWDQYIGKEIALHKCLCCKKTTISQTMFECGHVISIKEGGSEEIENLRPICSKCNKSMSTKNMKTYVIENGYLIG